MMITKGNTTVSMEFDSGMFTNKFMVSNSKLEYPNSFNHGISQDLILSLESSIASVVEAIITLERKRRK